MTATALVSPLCAVLFVVLLTFSTPQVAVMAPLILHTTVRVKVDLMGLLAAASAARVLLRRLGATNMTRADLRRLSNSSK